MKHDSKRAGSGFASLAVPTLSSPFSWEPREWSPGTTLNRPLSFLGESRSSGPCLAAAQCASLLDPQASPWSNRVRFACGQLLLLWG